MNEVSVNTGKTFQVIEGFGASGAWWPTWVRDFSRDDQQRMLRLLFTDEGAGLDIYRYNVPAGGSESVERPERRTPQIETAPGVYDFQADAAGIRFLRDIRELGVERFILFSNSPPARLTRNGQTSGGDQGGSNLDPQAAGDFARYLVDVAAYLKDELGLPHVTVSPINEPQWKWGEKGRGQEGCHYTPAEAAQTIRAVIDEIHNRGLPLPVEAPESGAWSGSESYAEALFTDPVINEALDTFALHSYWSRRSQKRAFTAWFKEHYPNKTLSMTEYCEMRGVHDLGIEAGLHLAGVIHDDLTIGSVTTWQWWLAIAAGGYADGLIYAHPGTQKIEVTKRLWALAHYARFVQPGYQRVEATCTDTDLQVSAYTSPDEKKVVLVMINPSEEPKRLSLRIIQQEPFGAGAYWVTTDDSDMVQHDTDDETLSLPARSIATFVADQHQETDKPGNHP